MQNESPGDAIQALYFLRRFVTKTCLLARVREAVVKKKQTQQRLQESHYEAVQTLHWWVQRYSETETS